MMIQEGIDIIKHIEDESYMDMKTSSSIPTEVKLNSYGSFKVQENPLFESFHQIGNCMPKNFYNKNKLAADQMEEFDEGNSYDVFSPSLCLKSLDGNFLYEENVYFNPLFLEEGIFTDDSQVGIQRQGSMTIAPEVASCHRLYEGNPLQSFVSPSLNHQKTLLIENFDIIGMKIEVIAYNVEDGINTTQKCLKIQDNLLEDDEEEKDHKKFQSNTDMH